MLLAIGYLHAVALLASIAVVARRARDRAAPEPPAADEIEELAAHAEAVAAALSAAATAAEEARQREADALRAREAAEDRYRQAEREAQAAAEPRRLVQRAAVNAYRRGQLSVTELNRIWQHLDAGPPEPAPPVHQARSQYELAVAEAEHVRRETHVTTVAADVLAEEAEIAESHLSAALRTADPGLALLRAG